MYHHAISNKQFKGFALLAVVTIMGALLLLTGYFIEQSIGETKISKSEVMANKSYYLAEAGANEAVYKLKNECFDCGNIYIYTSFLLHICITVYIYIYMNV